MCVRTILHRDLDLHLAALRLVKRTGRGRGSDGLGLGLDGRGDRSCLGRSDGRGGRVGRLGLGRRLDGCFDGLGLSRLGLGRLGLLLGLALKGRLELSLEVVEGTESWTRLVVNG